MVASFGDLLPGMVPAISEPPAPGGAMRSVALHRPAAVRATALPQDEDPEGLLAVIGAGGRTRVPHPSPPPRQTSHRSSWAQA